MTQAALLPDVETTSTKNRTGDATAEFTVNNVELAKELTNLQRIVPRKNSIPILQNVHLQAAQNKLFLTASDLDLSLRTACPAVVKKEGRVTVPAHKLYDYIRLLEDGNVTMRALENHWVQIRSGRSNTKMVGISADNYPTLPGFPADKAISLPAAALQYLIGRTHFAVSEEEIKYITRAALLHIKPDNLTMVGTDGNRLAVAEWNGANKAEEKRVLLPKKLLTELNSLLASATKDVLFAQDENTLYFAVGSRLLTSRCIAGSFPNYEAVLPKSHPHSIVLSHGELLLALQRVRQFSDDRSNCVRVRIDKNEVRLRSAIDGIGEAEETVSTSYTSEPITLGFNYQYILDFLRATDVENIRVHFSTPASAAELVPETDSKEASTQTTFRYIAMPLRV